METNYIFEKVFPYGFKVYRKGENENELIGYAPENFGEGHIYKDEKAFMRGSGVAYIAEMHFEYSEVEIEGRKVVDASHGVTRSDIFNGIEKYWTERYLLNDEQIEHTAKVLFTMMDWMNLESYLEEDTRMDDIVLRTWDVHDFRGFTNFQREAVGLENYPADYAEREPYMSELADWGREFDDAFIFDDNETYTQELMRYQEERKRGEVDNPLEYSEKYNIAREHNRYYVRR